jgi:hypothetical protein
MKFPLFALIVLLCGPVKNAAAQEITYSEAVKADDRNMNFEVLGNFSGNLLIYKNIYKTHEIAVYDNNMALQQTVKLDFISDRTSNIDFITYPGYFIMVWQFEKGNITYCRAARMTGEGKLIGDVANLDTTKTGLFSTKVSYDLARSDDKSKILVYKVQAKTDQYNLVMKVYDSELLLLDSSKQVLYYNENREAFGELQVDNAGDIVFSEVKENSRPEYINTLDINLKKLKNNSLFTVNIPLDKLLLHDPAIKIDNVNGRYIINSFSYRKNGDDVDGIFSAIVNKNPFNFTRSIVNLLPDSLREKMSGKPDWRTAYDNFSLRNIILEKDGGFIAVSEEYYKQRRYGSAFDDRNGLYGSRYYGSPTDYYLYNRGYYGYYRPYNDVNNRDIIYNYNDIITFSFTKDLRMQWNAVINKTTSDIENDNFLSFLNMNSGGEIHFLFLQKDNNKEIMSDHALHPDGSVTRYPTLKSREVGYDFMPRLGRQTGLHQVVIPCIVRNNMAFAKIDF